MNKREPADYLVYRYRYVIGYFALAAVFVAYLALAALIVPGGLTQAEIDMIGVTNQLDLANISSLAVTNLPLHLLQKLSFEMFGVRSFTVKLPSLIFAVLSSIAIFFLLRRWFKPRISILAMILMITASHFTIVAQSFTSSILLVFYSSVILLFASLIFQKARHQTLLKICLAISIAVSLTTPYFWYINLFLATVAFAHPHTRHFILRRKYLARWLPSALILTGLILSISYLITISETLATDLLGLQALQFDILQNTKTLIQQFFWVEPVVINGVVSPIFDFGVLLLIIFGLIASFMKYQTARSYMVLSWAFMAIPLLLLNPQTIAIITVPAFILLAVGLESLFYEWYKLFPKNPYARSSGLVLAITMIVVFSLTSTDNFINSYKHLPEAAAASSVDLRLFNQHLGCQPATIITSPDSSPIFDAFAANCDEELQVAVLNDQSISSDAETVIVQHDAIGSFVPAKNQKLTRIIVNDRLLQADRFLVYTTTDK